MNNNTQENCIWPKHVMIETVYGCNAKCLICPVNMPAKREKKVMSDETFKAIIKKILPYQKEISMLDLFGLGEPLIDSGIHNKIACAKNSGFRNIAIATNGMLLTEKKADQIIKAGLDTLLISIDGCDKNTHEKIRPGTDYVKVVKNVLAAIALRERETYSTRFVVRFIRQKDNYEQWESFRTFWNSKINLKKNDEICMYDAHNWGGVIDSPDSSEVKTRNNLVCEHPFKRLVINADGDVPLCCIDLYETNYKLGSIFEDELKCLYNSSKLNQLRNMHIAGKRNQIPICAKCTIKPGFELPLTSIKGKLL